MIRNQKKMTWSEFRFSIIGPLLAMAPIQGQTLKSALEKLAAGVYQNPTTGEEIRFGFSTIERWYYAALKANDPVGVLKKKRRKDEGQTRTQNPELLRELGQQYKDYPHWSYRLHTDNLLALSREKPELGRVPSYSTIQRLMKRKGWIKKRKPRKQTPGQLLAAERLEQREVRGYECDYVNALWHLDFHQSRLKVVTNTGEWVAPVAFCVLDDRSRLCCHIQWYDQEDTQNFVHGLSQAIYKRGLPRSLMTDNGGAMTSEESESGLLRLGIHHERTLPYSPYQNGKQESFWTQLEGRLLSMLTRLESPGFDELNKATQAWVELEYNQSAHRELKGSPMERFIAGPDVSRLSPDCQTIELAFTRRVNRRQRQSDGTSSLDGIRFEVPNHYRHMARLCLRYRSWDLRHAYLMGPGGDDLLAIIYPQDKSKNANGQRRFIRLESEDIEVVKHTEPYPPLMRQYLADYAALGVAGYIPQDNEEHKDEEP